MSQQYEDEPNEQNIEGEPPLEDFLFEEEEEDLEELARTKKRRHKFIKITAYSLCLFLIVNVLSIWLNLFSVDSINLKEESERLSQEELIHTWKEAVVTIQTDGSKGTGFSVSTDGLIVTNHHVIDGTGAIIISFPSGDKFVGEVLDSNEAMDIAIIEIEGIDLPYLPLSKDSANIGEAIYVIGNPLFQSQIVNEGIILEKTDTYDVIKISNSIYKGHSGSPVLTENGEVVAVVYAKTIPTLFAGDESEGLAVPIEYVVESIEALN